jgi:hypothetical protein
MEFQMVNRETAEKVFIAAYNNAGAVLQPGTCVVWTATTTTANQGYHVQLPGALDDVTGIGAKVAGVVETTINTAGKGRLQVYGPADVRASASLESPKVVVTGSFQDTQIGVVVDGTQADTTEGMKPSYDAAVVGITLQNNPSDYKARVHLALM